MADPRYDLTAVRAVPAPDGGYVSVIWNAVIVDSTGFEYRHGRGYKLERDTPWSSAAAALLAAARTEADVMAAVHADAARALAEFEARVTSGAVEAAPVVLFAAPARPLSDPSPTPPEPIEG